MSIITAELDRPAAAALIQSNVIERAESQRNAALSRFREAYDLLHDAMDLVPGENKPTSDICSAMCSYQREPERFMEKVKKHVDAIAWQHLIEDHGFEKLMDRKAREQFRGQLQKDPPELVASTARATLVGLLADADMLFQRGIAEAFSSLDRRFRSHDGFKIGSRIVLNHAIEAGGYWNHHRRQDDTLRDVERVFCRLAGKELPERESGIVAGVQTAARRSRPAVVEHEFFRIRIFANGNLHIWFKRDDLVRECNKLLAEYYGDVIGAAYEVAGKGDPLANPNRTLAKNGAFYPTPDDVVGRMMENASPRYWDEPFTVLEPSAGEGAIACAVRERYKLADITCVEVNLQRAATLRAKGLQTRTADFLDESVDSLGLFDRVYMNPPFDLQRDIDHVAHAVKFLAPGGKLVAVMSAGVEFRENAKAVAFRELVKRMGGRFWDLPAGTFAESGTNVNTCLVTLQRAA